jgi:XTP/dITP diphosphohydrolase
LAAPREGARAVLATRNKGKREEVRRILEPAGIRVLDLDDFPGVSEVEETGGTFLENALLKARATARETGFVALADDSGLEVDALGGAPGVRSARYAGEPRSDARNNAKLLDALARVAPASRGARFCCVAAAALPDGKAVWAEGMWRGIVLVEPRGTSGFGYDPLFLDPMTGKTAAEMTPSEKDAHSHRGKAFRALLVVLPQILGGAQRAR